MSNKMIVGIILNIICIAINITALTLAFVWFGWEALIVTFFAMLGAALNARLSYQSKYEDRI